MYRVFDVKSQHSNVMGSSSLRNIQEAKFAVNLVQYLLSKNTEVSHRGETKVPMFLHRCQFVNNIHSGVYYLLCIIQITNGSIGIVTPYKQQEAELKRQFLSV